ncbi:hypothetical protein HBI70_217920 [Parastagonospora nodorum]|nr:hypothetical protein HBI10_221860 [Parastagonospora nodorum]KAH4009660.1 hypothetical protein HBI13_217610 [Parastagonospora nodorum]KAH4113276.1 hypothetical protein HBH47_213760 [Parastagonospora nodorum]KAH4402765.1 hypothetical protein HBH92_207490 [Parastagonospora nodorum]KAH4415708.1 hypothetical protein HBH93_213680 [Parastagonospora nodorum]
MRKDSYLSNTREKEISRSFYICSTSLSGDSMFKALLPSDFMQNSTGSLFRFMHLNLTTAHHYQNTTMPKQKRPECTKSCLFASSLMFHVPLLRKLRQKVQNPVFASHRTTPPPQPPSEHSKNKKKAFCIGRESNPGLAELICTDGNG